LLDNNQCYQAHTRAHVAAGTAWLKAPPQAAAQPSAAGTSSSSSAQYAYPLSVPAQVCNDPKKTLTVMLYDNCDKCSPGQVNLQAAPFKTLAPLDIGRIGIQFREVDGGGRAGLGLGGGARGSRARGRGLGGFKRLAPLDITRIGTQLLSLQR
jgi:hypothetical protein